MPEEKGMKKFLVFVFSVSLVLTLVSCPPRYNGQGKASIYIGKVGVDKVNSVVGDEAVFDMTIKLDNASFVEAKVTKGLDISKWLTLKNLDKDEERASLNATVMSVSDSHINKSDKKLLDTLVAKVKITSKKEADGMLSVEVPTDYFTLNNPTKDTEKKAIAATNKIVVISKDKFYVKAMLDKKEIVSNYTFGQTDKKEIILSLANADFKDEVLKPEVLSDKSKFDKYITIDLQSIDVVDNYKFTFALNGARKNSLKLLITSDALMKNSFEVKALPIKVIVLKSAYTPNKGANIKTERLETVFSFTKAPESKPAATINYLNDNKLTTDIELSEGQSRECKMLITLSSDSFNNTLLTKDKDVLDWFSLPTSENAKIDSAVVESLVASPLSEKETTKIYTQLYCIVKLTGVKAHEGGKNTQLAVKIPTLINGTKLFTRSKEPITVGNAINITVVK